MFNHVSGPTITELTTIESETEGRKYVTPQGLIYPSVTTVLGAKSKPGIELWKSKVGEEEAAKVLNQASVRGTEFHLLAENYLNNKEDWSKDAQPINVFTFNTIKTILDNHVDNVYYQEVPLYSDRLKTAGRADCIAEYNGELSIIDFKTSRKKKKEEWISSYFCQAAFYSAALFERTNLLAKQCVIIMAVDDEYPDVFIQPVHKWLGEFKKIRDQYSM